VTAARLSAAVLLVMAYLALCAWTWLTQRRKRRHAAREAAALTPAVDGGRPWLIAYASQTGFAEQLAWQSARTLHTGGVAARVAALSDVRLEDLAAAERVLFVASTYGEGDPPDNASLFFDRLMQAPASLPRLHYGLLMLGDRRFARFCGFGRALDAWLRASGAQPMFDSIVVGNEEAAALNAWQHHLNRIAGTSDAPDWQAPAYRPWRLMRRTQLNPGSVGGPIFHLELQTADGAAADWEAGDLVQIRAPGDPDHPREYSIASIPADGRIHLLVRQERHADGSLGIASGWLTAAAAIGDAVDLRVRPHGNFRIGANAQRPLILIGNGTGLAGLRSHLRARAAVAARGSDAPRNWLIFGERHAAHDALHSDEIAAWQAQGVLARADLVFSRDGAVRHYVQDSLREQADRVRMWVLQDGAAIYVCGSLQGMAAGVEAALEEILGADQVRQLIEVGRYRRDVY